VNLELRFMLELELDERSLRLQLHRQRWPRRAFAFELHVQRASRA